MSWVAAAIAVLFLLGAINLLLTLGVVRRLREYADVLSGMKSLVPSGGSRLLPVGESPGDFSTLTTDGETVSRSSLRDGSVVAFWGPHCQPCAAKLPALLELLASLPGGRQAALTVVQGGEAESAALVSRLRPVTRVVVEPNAGPTASAFQARATPTLYVLDAEGRVRAAGHDPERLSLAANA